ncbi:Hypothetical protein D9617_14g075210 [Elsinoe fawcettii]|nr:Hypothetical protein D9617_14g075210 [Elsinoe fawcettii]
MKVVTVLVWTLCLIPSFVLGVPPRPKLTTNLPKTVPGPRPQPGPLSQPPRSQSGDSSSTSSPNQPPQASAQKVPPAAPARADTSAGQDAQTSKILSQVEKLSLNTAVRGAGRQSPTSPSGSLQGTGSPPSSPVNTPTTPGGSPQTDALVRSGTVGRVELTKDSITPGQVLESAKQTYAALAPEYGGVIMVASAYYPGVGTVHVSKPGAVRGQNQDDLVNAVLSLAREYAPEWIPIWERRRTQRDSNPKAKDRTDLDLIHVEDFAYIKMKEMLKTAGVTPKSPSDAFGVPYGRTTGADKVVGIKSPCGRNPTKQPTSMQPGCWPSQEELGLISWLTRWGEMTQAAGPRAQQVS